jgi:hypothetical protein
MPPISVSRHLTEFDMQARHLQLAPEDYLYSTEPRRWCERNKDRCYIPEWLLAKWHIPVDPSLSDVA